MISSKALGLIFLFITSAAWIGASFITQALVSRSEQTEAALEPWLLTLICSSTLMLYLPIGHFARKRARYEGRVTRAARSPRPRTRHRKGPTVVASDDVALEHAGCLLPRRRLVLLLTLRHGALGSATLGHAVTAITTNPNTAPATFAPI